MLGHGGLLHAKGFDDLSDRPFRAEGQEVENLAPARFSHCIESIGGCCCSRHACQYILIWEYVKRYCVYFCLSLANCNLASYRACTMRDMPNLLASQIRAGCY